MCFVDGGTDAGMFFGYFSSKDYMRKILGSEQRAAGAIFDRFGVACIRKGGKYVTRYLDDLTYTANRPEADKPVHHPQQVITVPYPSEDRQHW